MPAATNFAIAKLRNNGIATTMMATHDSNTTEKKQPTSHPGGTEPKHKEPMASANENTRQTTPANENTRHGKITDDPGGTEPSNFFKKTARALLKKNMKKPTATANENTRQTASANENTQHGKNNGRPRGY